MLTYPKQQTVSTRDLAWNTAGTALDSGTRILGDGAIAVGAMTAADALRLGGLADWNVRRAPLTTDLFTAGDDGGILIPGKYANLATIGDETKVLGVVGKRYRIVQNEETAELLDAIVDESGAHYVAAGSVSNFSKTFVVMKLPSGILIGGEDATDLYMGVTNTHDGSGALEAWVTGVRLRCTNMLNTAIKGAQARWSMRHTDSVTGKVQAARESLQLTFAWAEDFQRQMEEFYATPFPESDFERLLDRIVPASESEHEGWRKRQQEKRDTLRFLFNEAETNALGRLTKWGAYNAFTEYADWYMPVKGVDLDGSRRAERILASGTVTNLKQRAYAELVRA